MRYAKALLSFAAELHEDEQAYAEMSALSQAFVAVPALHPAAAGGMQENGEKRAGPRAAAPFSQTIFSASFFAA